MSVELLSRYVIPATYTVPLTNNMKRVEQILSSLTQFLETYNIWYD